MKDDRVYPLHIGDVLNRSLAYTELTCLVLIVGIGIPIVAVIEGDKAQDVGSGLQGGLNEAPIKLTPPKEPRVVVERWFAVSMDGRRIGKARFTVHDFTDTRVKRSGWEYFVYPDAQAPHGYRFWARCYNSLSYQGQPGATWVTGWWDGQGFSYRLQSGHPHALFRRNLFGKSDSGREVQVHADFRLGNQVYQALGELFAKQSGRYSCRYFNAAAPIEVIEKGADSAYPGQTFVVDGMEEVLGPDGREIKSARIKHHADAEPSKISFLWIDEHGWPTRKEIPYAHDLKLMLISQQEAERGSVVDWSQAHTIWQDATGLAYQLLNGTP